MNIRIEDAFHDCFERMLCGESLESCVSRYPQFAIELDSMLRTSYDVKRKAYPIQPRPEFKYWARVRMQNVQQYGAQPAHEGRPVSFNLRRNLAISLAALLVFTIASSGTVAASSDAMPDEPLYGVKLVVEQAQVTLAPSEIDKAEVYAQLTEKRAQEIAVMAAKGNDEKVIATTNIMNYQLQKLEENMVKFEIAYEAEQAKKAAGTPWASTTTNPTPFTAVVPPAPTGSTFVPPLPPVPPSTPVPSDATATTVAPSSGTGTTGVPPVTAADAARKFTPPAAGSSNQTTAASGQSTQDTQRTLKITRAREVINNSTAKSLTILQGALDKAPASTKSNLNNVINQTLTTNKRIQTENSKNSGFIQGGQNTGSDNKTNPVNTRPFTDSTIKPNIDKKPVVNPVDRLQNRPFLNPDNKLVK